MLAAASTGALTALLVVIAIGLLLRRPAAMIPEYAEIRGRQLLCAFATFWVGEGQALEWPCGDWSLAALGLGYLLLALVEVMNCRHLTRSRAGHS
jgi:uncharacterized membrane protein